jgi:hypothetical protein
MPIAKAESLALPSFSPNAREHSIDAPCGRPLISTACAQSSW